MGLDPVRIIDEVRENFHMTDFSDCGPTAAFENPSKMGRMMSLRHAKCEKSENKYDLFCRPDQCSLTNSYVDTNSSLISE
jgi:hypothetical protein